MNNKWGFWVLTAFVVGNMVGSGIFMLPSSLAQTASPLGVILAWVISGFGALMIALVFGNLSVRRPELKAGPQSYARALFSTPKYGNVAGFSMVWGYWVANWIANVAVITSFAGYLSTFFPIMKSTRVLFSMGSSQIEMGKLVTFIICSILLWGTHFILSSNINNAGKLNFAATVSKVVGFLLFIVSALFVFQASNFGQMYLTVVDGSGVSHGLLNQIQMAAISTLWAFVGVESAVVLSGRAATQRDVKKATIVGLCIALLIYMGISVLTMGVLPQDVLQASDKPLVDALAVIIGSTGANIMAILALICLFGSTIGWILIASEVPYQAAKQGVFPAFFGKTNKKSSPVNALKVTNVMSQVFIFSLISGTISEAYLFLTTAATLAFLIPYLVSAIYFFKLIITGETYETIKGSRVMDGIISALAVIYAIWIIIAGTADLKTFGLGIGLFLAGFIFYPLFNKARKDVPYQVVEKDKKAV